MGVSYLHPQGNADNGVLRSLSGSGTNIRVPVSIPAGTYWTGGWYVVGASGVASVSFDGGTFRLNGTNVGFRGGQPGSAPSQPARGYYNDSLQRTWDGGMGGYIVWAYYAPGAPSLQSASRSSNGTSLSITINSGSGRVTGDYVSLDAYTWNGNGTTFSVGAHSTVTMYGLSVNEDNNSGWVNVGTSYGIPTAVQNFSVSKGTSNIGGRIDGSWNAPTYAGSSLNRYVVNRYDTVTGVTTKIIDANVISFNDTDLIRGRLYNYSIYAIGNNSPGNGLATTINGVMAPGVPNAPGTPTVANKIGRNVTINSTRGSDGYGNAITEYRIQLSTDNGVTWKGWDNSTKAFTADNTYNTLDGSGNFTYQLLTPALTYKWRVYAVNSIGAGDTSTTVSGTFVSSGGRRWSGTTWEPTQSAKRFDGTNWVDLTIAKRWDGSSWIDLSQF